MMKKILFSLLIISLSVCVTSCSKEGPAGPQGAEGEAGPAGPTGPQGPNGNANVTLYNFNAYTHNLVEITKEFAMSAADFNQSLLYAYVHFNSGGGPFWYPLPGHVTNTHHYRVFFSSISVTRARIFMTRTQGTTNQDFLALRVYAVKANTTINAGNGRRVLGVTAPDGTFYSDDALKEMSHEAFCQALGIQE